MTIIQKGSRELAMKRGNRVAYKITWSHDGFGDGRVTEYGTYSPLVRMTIKEAKTRYLSDMIDGGFTGVLIDRMEVL